MSIVFWPPWLDDDEAWRTLFSDSKFVSADSADRARAFNVMILHILRTKVPEKGYLAARSRVIEIAGNWLKSGEGVPDVLLPELKGDRYEENLASLRRQRFAVLEVRSAPAKGEPRMIDDAEKNKRLEVVKRIAIGMAEKNDDPILLKTHILAESTFEGKPKSADELDGKNPVATQDDGGRYFPHVRMDGRGQLNIIWPSGIEKTIKFWIPEKYLTDEPTPGNSTTNGRPAASPSAGQNHGTEAEQALRRMRKVDKRVPLCISDIPGFPFADFAEMQQEVRSGRFAIAKFSFHQDPTILGLVSPGSRILYLASIAATYLIPLASVVLAFTVSPWFWLGLLYFFVGARLTINIWRNSILRAAFQSESAFCLLFYSSKINAYDLTNSAEYEWQRLTGKG